MTGNSRWGRWLARLGVLAVLATTGCATAGDILNGVSGSTVNGEVRGVDRTRLQLRDEYSGRTETLRVDGRTRVVYQNREYPVSALERGDIVSVRVERDGNGQRWAEWIEVRRSVSDGDIYDRDGDIYGRDGDVYRRDTRVQRLDGNVAQVDYRRGLFVLQQARNINTTVYVPNRLDREDQRRFERLRRGERARVDVRLVGRNQAELVRFR